MTEKQPRKRKQEGIPAPTPEQERRVLFAEVTIGVHGEASGEHLLVPGGNRGSTSGMYGEQGQARALQDLAEGGFVIDLRPLADNPHLYKWVLQAPMPNGQIEGNEIDRLPERVRHSAGDLAPFLGGEFQHLAAMAALGYGEKGDGSAGMFDYVSAAYRAVYWGTKGAFIGRRVGDTIEWSNGTQQPLEPTPQRSTMPPPKPGRRRKPT